MEPGRSIENELLARVSKLEKRRLTSFARVSRIGRTDRLRNGTGRLQNAGRATAAAQ